MSAGSKCAQHNRAAVLSVRSMQHVRSHWRDVQHDPHCERSHATRTTTSATQPCNRRRVHVLLAF
eukprot:14893403-Alexandrium_andersonii.AAC.1